MSEGNVAATFHVYLNKDELPCPSDPKAAQGISSTYDEAPPHKKNKPTNSAI